MLLKSTPEDFVVDEVLDTAPLLDESGGYSLYILKKRLWNTEDCVQWLAKGLKKERKDFGVCGNKDKHAVTTQYLTVKGGPKDLHGCDAAEGSDGGKWFTTEYVGKVKEPLRLGAHTRNRFTITVRELDAAREDATPTLKPILNLFGEQRFSEQNDVIGMHLIRKQYKDACKALGHEPGTDPVSVLRNIPKHVRILYVHAAQSRLWNELAKATPLSADGSNPNVPVPGYGPNGTPEQLAAMDSLLEREGLDRMSFVNKSMPELSVEGGERALLQDVQEFAATKVENGVCTLSFTLGTGQYATETVRQLFEQNA